MKTTPVFQTFGNSLLFQADLRGVSAVGRKVQAGSDFCGNFGRQNSQDGIPKFPITTQIDGRPLAPPLVKWSPWTTPPVLLSGGGVSRTVECVGVACPVLLSVGGRDELPAADGGVRQPGGPGHLGALDGFRLLLLLCCCCCCCVGFVAMMARVAMRMVRGVFAVCMRGPGGGTDYTRVHGGAAGGAGHGVLHAAVAGVEAAGRGLQ